MKKMKFYKPPKISETEMKLVTSAVSLDNFFNIGIQMILIGSPLVIKDTHWLTEYSTLEPYYKMSYVLGAVCTLVLFLQAIIPIVTSLLKRISSKRFNKLSESFILLILQYLSKFSTLGSAVLICFFVAELTTLLK